MKRREFISLLGAAAAGWPLAVRAQQGKQIPRIGVLWPNPPAMFDFLGYVEGPNIDASPWIPLQRLCRWLCEQRCCPAQGLG